VDKIWQNDGERKSLPPSTIEVRIQHLTPPSSEISNQFLSQLIDLKDIFNI